MADNIFMRVDAESRQYIKIEAAKLNMTMEAFVALMIKEREEYEIVEDEG